MQFFFFQMEKLGYIIISTAKQKEEKNSYLNNFRYKEGNMTANGQQKKQNQEISKNHVSKRDYDPFNGGGYNPVKGEMALWTAVITQALMDAGSESRKPEAQHEKAKAVRWLLGNSEDFVTVCQNAGLDPQSVRQKAIHAIERGCVWRNGMAEKRQAQSISTLHKKSCVPTRLRHAPPPLHVDFSRPSPAQKRPSEFSLPMHASHAMASAIH